VFGIDPAATADVLAELVATGHTATRIGSVIDADPGLRLR